MQPPYLTIFNSTKHRCIQKSLVARNPAKSTLSILVLLHPASLEMHHNPKGSVISHNASDSYLTSSKVSDLCCHLGSFMDQHCFCNGIKTNKKKRTISNHLVMFIHFHYFFFISSTKAVFIFAVRYSETCLDVSKMIPVYA